MIKLLNNETWGKEEILAEMVSDTFYYEHLGKYALSSSALSNLLKSAKTYRQSLNFAGEETTALMIGKVFHWMILEPEKMDNVKILDVTSRNTKAYKEAREKHHHILLKKEVADVEHIADAVLQNEVVKVYLKNAEFEVPAIEMIDGLPFRGKADIIKGRTIIDLKTTSSNLKDFVYSADKYNYDMQCYLYMKLFKATDFKFIVVNKQTKDIGVFETSEEFYEKGGTKFKQAVSVYRHFFEEQNDLDQYILRGIL